MVAVDGGAVVAEQGFDTGATFGVAISPDTRWGAGAAPSGHGLQVADLRSKSGVRQLVGDTTCDAHISPAFSADSKHVYAVAGSKSRPEAAPSCQFCIERAYGVPFAPVKKGAAWSGAASQVPRAGVAERGAARRQDVTGNADRASQRGAASRKAE